MIGKQCAEYVKVVAGVVERMKSSKMEGGATPTITTTTSMLLGLMLVICTLPLIKTVEEKQSEAPELPDQSVEAAALGAMMTGLPAETRAKYKLFSDYSPMYRMINFTKGQNLEKVSLTEVQANLEELVENFPVGSHLAIAEGKYHDMLLAIQGPPTEKPTKGILRGAHRDSKRIKKWQSSTWAPGIFQPACKQLLNNMLKRTHSRKDLKQYVHASYKHCVIAYFVSERDKASPITEKPESVASSHTSSIKEKEKKVQATLYEQETAYLENLKKYPKRLLHDKTVRPLGERQTIESND